MSTDAQLDFSVGRTARSIERRVSSADAMLCPCSLAIIAVAGNYRVEGDGYGRKNIGHRSRGFLVIQRSWLFADTVFGRDRSN